MNSSSNQNKSKAEVKSGEFRNFYMHITHSGQLSAQTFSTVQSTLLSIMITMRTD